MATATVSAAGHLAAATSSADCTTQLRTLYDAYTRIITGQNTVSVQSADFRKIEYGQGNLPALIQQYNALWDTCAGGGAGLPKIGPQRGGPVYLG